MQTQNLLDSLKKNQKEGFHTFVANFKTLSFQKLLEHPVFCWAHDCRHFLSFVSLYESPYGPKTR